MVWEAKLIFRYPLRERAPVAVDDADFGGAISDDDSNDGLTG